jgi:hypothetical protein
MLACNMVLATPTQVIEMPTGTVVPEEEYNWGLDLRTTFGGGGAVGVRPGLTYGATEDFEIGVDWATNYPANGVLLNAKWRVTDEDKDDALAVGLMGVGLNFNQTPNVLYAVATLQDDDDDEDDDDTFNFHVGAYYGTNANYFGASQFGFMAGADFGDDEWRGIVEYMSGNNPLGVFSAGVGYMDEDNEWRAVLAYQYWLQQRQSGVTLQIDYFTD